MEKVDDKNRNFRFLCCKNFARDVNFFIEKLFFFFSYDFLSLDGGEGGTRARIFVHSHLKCTVGSRNKFPRVFFHESDFVLNECEQSSSKNVATLALNVKHPTRRVLSLTYQDTPFVSATR